MRSNYEAALVSLHLTEYYLYWYALPLPSGFPLIRAFVRSAIHLVSATQGNPLRPGKRLAEWMRMQISKVALFIVVILVCVSLIFPLFAFIASRSNAASTCRFDFHPDKIFCRLRKISSTHPESSFKAWFAALYCEIRLPSFS